MSTLSCLMKVKPTACHDCMCTVCFPEKAKTKERECERMREFSDPKCFVRLAEMQDLPSSNEIGFSPKCFSRSVSPNVESSDCKCRLQCEGLSETIASPNEINVFPEMFSLNASLVRL